MPRLSSKTTSTKSIQVGRRVKVHDVTYDEDLTTIVGSTEADSPNGKISNESP